MVNQHDRGALRELAKRVAEIAALPEVAGRPALWRQHNSLHPPRPLILVFPGGGMGRIVAAAGLRLRGGSGAQHGVRAAPSHLHL